jgi:hypothetical protein
MPENRSHRCSLSETNAHNIVALCSCGWVGAVHIPPSVQTNKPGKFYRDVDAAQRAAKLEHTHHARDRAAVDAGR